MTGRPLSELVLDRVTEGLAAADLSSWAQRRLGERLWSKQREIADSVREHRYTAVPSCHGAGKSHLASRLLLWWLTQYPVGDAFVVTSAPTAPQLAGVVWRYVAQAHARAGLPGRVTGGQVPALHMGGQLVAWGRKPTDYTEPSQAMASFQGIHARHVLVLLDEACGIPRWLYDAADTLATSEHARVLAIGNPDSPGAHFAKICRPGSGWNVIRVAADDTPNFTGEPVAAEVAEALVSRRWVAERERRWGRESALFASKVLAKFPDVSEDTLIGADLIVAAQERELDEPDGAGVLACDVARLGGDRTVVYRNRGGVVRLVRQTPRQDTMRTVGDLIALRRHDAHWSSELVLDVGGLGIGVYDRLVEQDVPVAGFNAANRASRPERFANRRAEVFWALREAMLRGQVDLDPADEELAAQLGCLRWHHDSRGRIQIESKDELRKRGLPSPDRADSVAMTFLWPDAWAPRRVRTEADELAEVRAQLEEAARRREHWEALAGEGPPPAGSLTADLLGADL